MAKHVVTTGLKEIDSRLRQIEPRVGNKIARRGLRAGLQPVRETAKRLVPKKTGALRRGIKIRSGKKSRKGFRMVCRVGQEGWYHTFQEWGWRAGKAKKKIPGKQYMRLAYKENAKKSIDLARTVILKDLDEEIRRLSALR